MMESKYAAFQSGMFWIEMCKKKPNKIPDFTSADLNPISPYAGLEACTRVGGLSGLVGSQGFRFCVSLPNKK